MGVVITRDDIVAYAEVNYIIHHMNIRYLEMLPKKLVDFLDKMKDPYYEVYVDPHKPLQNQGLKQYTLEIIALLHLKYWCEDEERRKELYRRMETNQINFEEKLKEKFNVDNIFEDKEEKEEPKEDLSKPKKINTISKENQIENKNLASEKENIVETKKEEIAKTKKEGFFKRIIIKIKELFK